MNIFALSTDPAEAVRMYCDRHVVKMLLEDTQLLCNVFHFYGHDFKDFPRHEPYKVTHLNHPCSIWARSTLGNFMWLLLLTGKMAEEYSERYNKIHACTPIIEWITDRFGDLPLPVEERQPFIVPSKDFSVYAQFDPMPDRKAIRRHRQFYMHKYDLIDMQWRYCDPPRFMRKKISQEITAA